MNAFLLKKIQKHLSCIKDEPRPYIGASSIGNNCERAIWYGLNEPDNKEVSDRQRLTFKIGYYLEDMILTILTDSGLMFRRNVELTCHEFPLFSGHVDGLIFNDGVIEIKTAKDSSFNIFKRKGIRLWYPEYYDQVQSYLGMSRLKRCYFLVLNKDTSELCEQVVELDEERYKFLVAKAKRINEYSTPPRKINESASYFKCKICFYNKHCHS